MSMGITLIEPDGQPDLPDEYTGMSYYQNLGEEAEVLSTLKEKKVSGLFDLVNWGAMDGEDSQYHPASQILAEAEKLQTWLTANEEWDEFEFGREAFLQDLDELLQVLRFSVENDHSFSLDFC
jgi:hypothetical protein